jgi:ABC-2 type transport system permease protein
MTTLDVKRASWHAYAAIARIALREQRSERMQVLTRVAFLGLVILLFSRVWLTLLPRTAEGMSATDCVWYVAITEWITLSQPRLFLEIERDVRGGDLAYQLSRPTSYLFGKLIGALAQQAQWLLVLGVSAVGMAYTLADGWPRDAWSLLWALPLGLLASVLGTLFSALIGLSAFWLTDCSPLAWVFNKLTFVLGGLFVPLTLYPAWLRGVALVTPFAALVYGPGQMAIRGGGERGFSVAWSLGVWIAIASAALALLYHRGVRAVELHGG